MATREEILKEAISTGEVIKAYYYGGSNHGAERELVVRKLLPNGYVKCFCLRDKIEKTFFLNKIEIEGMSVEDFVDKDNLEKSENKIGFVESTLALLILTSLIFGLYYLITGSQFKFIIALGFFLGGVIEFGKISNAKKLRK